MFDTSRMEAFLSDQPENPLIVIYGPTASGKTRLSIDIASTIGGEIISADSRQIYRGLDVGTGKITEEEMRGIPHYMLDIITPDRDFSVVEYRDMAHPILEDIWKRGKLPIICGGTGLYIDSLIYERSFPNIPPDRARRKELEEIARVQGNEAVWGILARKDPDYAKALHPNNLNYVMRAIEVFEATGSSKSLIQDIPTLKYPTLFLTPYEESEFIPELGSSPSKAERKIRKLRVPPEREILYRKIDERIDEMFSHGLVEEVGYNIREYGAHCPGLKTIGYAEIVDSLEGKTSLEEAINLVKQHNRNYAKRQITWNKKYAWCLTP